MFTTHKLHCAYVGGRYDDLSVQDLVIQFKGSEDKKEKDKIYSSLFCKLFPMIYKIQSKYISLTYEQKVEYTDLCLMNSLRNYKLNSKAKFMSYFYGNLSRCFLGFSKIQNTNTKKAVWNNIVTLDQDLVKTILGNIPERKSFVDNFDFFDTLNNSSLLNSLEKDYCKLLYAGFSKVADLISIFNEFNYSENKKRVELKKLKDNLKEKIRKNNYKLF